ncbi:MAG: LytR/AlgR family response regulator transcription factor [Saprospiraceae bacterium]
MRILIIEDEHKAAVLLKELIEFHSGYQVVHICDSIESSVTFLSNHQQDLDLLFMDIQLSDGQSFEIFEKIKVQRPVIFCTSYNEFTLKAFKNHGIDYILKPFNKDDIQMAIAKIEELKGNFTAHAPDISNIKEIVVREKTYQTSFLVRFKEKIYPVPIADIAFVHLDNEIAHLYTFKGEKHPIFKTMDEIENAIPPQDYYRINRQMIVHRNSIKEIENYFGQKLLVKLNIAIPEKALVSSKKATHFLSWVENPLR